MIHDLKINGIYIKIKILIIKVRIIKKKKIFLKLQKNINKVWLKYKIKCPINFEVRILQEEIKIINKF